MSDVRALIVEDDASWQEILGELLADFGLKVDVAGDLNSAGKSIRANPHRLAVVDLSLSPNEHNNTDGLRVLDAIRTSDPNCRAILLTGFATVELAVSALTEYGAFTFLRKENFQRAEFRQVVERILISSPGAQIASVPANVEENRGEENRFGTALVVDDDAGWRSILSELLAELGYDTIACAGFGEAFGQLQRQRISLAVIDLSLSEASGGYRLLDAARTQGVPTIVVSGVDEPDEIRRIYSEHAISAYVEKRAFDRALFAHVVEQTRATNAGRAELSDLTAREREVLELLAQGLTNKEIAERLVITTNTVKRHVKAVFEKLGVHTRSAAATKAAAPRA